MISENGMDALSYQQWCRYQNIFLLKSIIKMSLYIWGVSSLLEIKAEGKIIKSDHIQGGSRLDVLMLLLMPALRWVPDAYCQSTQTPPLQNNWKGYFSQARSPTGFPWAISLSCNCAYKTRLLTHACPEHHRVWYRRERWDPADK